MLYKERKLFIPKVYLNLLLTETLSKLISKRNRSDITTAMPYGESLRVNHLNEQRVIRITEGNCRQRTQTTSSHLKELMMPSW